MRTARLTGVRYRCLTNPQGWEEGCPRKGMLCVLRDKYAVHSNSTVRSVAKKN